MVAKPSSQTSSSKQCMRERTQIRIPPSSRRSRRNPHVRNSSSSTQSQTPSSANSKVKRSTSRTRTVNGSKKPSASPSHSSKNLKRPEKCHHGDTHGKCYDCAWEKGYHYGLTERSEIKLQVMDQ